MALQFEGANGQYRVDVDQYQRLRAQSVTEPEGDFFTLKGRAFNFNIGDYTLTNASTANALLYAKNSGTYPWVVPSQIWLFGNTTSGTGDIKYEVILNPTTGTLIDSGDDAATDVQNRDGRSTNTLTGTFKKASANGQTLTDGRVVVQTRDPTPTGRKLIAPGIVVIGPGNAIGLRYTTPASNTSQIVQVAIPIYEWRFDT